MGILLRVLAFVVFFAAVGGATYGAYQVFEPEATFVSVTLTAPQAGVTVPAGGTAPFSVGVENVGDADVAVTLRSTVEGLSVDQEAPVTVPAGAPRQVQATLRAERALSGAVEARLEAVNAETQAVLGTVRFAVNVFQPVAPGLRLDAMVPAVVPGGTAILVGTVSNPSPSPQQFQLALSGAEGVVAPPSASVPASGETRVKITVQVPEDASGTFSPVLEARLGAEGEPLAAAAADLPVVPAGEVEAAALFDAVQVRPGEAYGIPVVLVTNLDGEPPVNVAADGLLDSTLTSAPARGAIAGFVTLRAPDPLPADGTTVTISIAVGDGTLTLPIEVRPATSGDTADLGTRVEVDYIGRLASGEVFDSSFVEVLLGPFPKTSFFQERLQTRPLGVDLNPQQPNVIEGFFNALVGIREGQTRTAVLPPAQAYGGVRAHENMSAETVLNRVDRVPRYLTGFEKSQLPPEFDIQNKEVGDTITYRTEAQGVPLVFRFRVSAETETTVDLERLEREGDRTTFYTPWPNGTEVVEVTETEIVFRTTPSADLGVFTWNANPVSHQAGWGNVTTVEEVTDERIVLHHAPEPGTAYQASAGGGPPVQYRVEDVMEDRVQISRANPSPLAGKTLVFDVVARDVQAASQPDFTMGSGTNDGHEH